jgi:hypothetical protein
MKHSIQAALHVEKLKRAIQERGLQCGKASRRHHAKALTAAKYADLADIHQEIAAKRRAGFGPEDDLVGVSEE